MKDFVMPVLLLLISIFSLVMTDRSIFWLIIALLGVIFAVWEVYDLIKKRRE
ncbi:hypothetical protein [Holzapfeliella floricola]|uniref:Uncharacterized protein n=1 Tax=Holzapfeliella floricola DSM 23037 = JCM 16512 TaxID=1423744 RepID=A0A0R2DIQ8_9LACO|nr:hypothetical protein [Holzapfeliella floricola]KRN03976.1 hypothetical protein FC86_GL000503 [Holzapfeliella floricola DSM 23037 = JCM 16512]